jgi:hypothetical protein
MKICQDALVTALLLVNVSAFAQGSEPPDEMNPPVPADMAGPLEKAPHEAPPVEAESAPHVTFSRGTYREGIERLRIVRRENTANNIALQAAISIGVSLLSRGVVLGAAGFSKEDLLGDEVEGLDASVSENPAVSDLPRAVGESALRIYRERRADGTNPSAAPPAEFPAVVMPRSWKLVYENLSGDDELFRLNFGAALTWKPRFLVIQGRPTVCSYLSESATLSQWRESGWQRLREERSRALLNCAKTFDAALPDWL